MTTIPLSKRIDEIAPSPTLSISAKAKELKKKGIDVVGFGAGEPDFDTPSNIKEAGIKAIKNGFTKYTPTSGIDELKEAIVEKFKKDNNISYDKSQIIVGCGAKHVLYNIFLAVCNPGDEVIILSPYWVSYIEMIKLAGAVPVVLETLEEDGFTPKPLDIRNAITGNTKILVINSPNNPTGSVYPKGILKEIADIVTEKNILVISDEVYEKMVYGENRHFSIGSFNEEITKRTITVNAVSKTYAMTGWRIGYAGGPKEIISAMAKIQDHSTSNPSSISQLAAVAAIRGKQDDAKMMMEEFARRRNYVIERCKALCGVSFFPPQGAFYVFLNVKSAFNRLHGIKNSLDFTQTLLNNAHVAVVPGSAFGADNYIRVTFATSLDEIAKGFDRIEKFLKG